MADVGELRNLSEKSDNLNINRKVVDKLCLILYNKLTKKPNTSSLEERKEGQITPLEYLYLVTR